MSADYGRLRVELFNLTTRQKQVAQAISDAVEKRRSDLIEANPSDLIDLGLLAHFMPADDVSKIVDVVDSLTPRIPNRNESTPWDEILLSHVPVVQDAAARCKGTTAEVITCAGLLDPHNWQAVMWAGLFERTFDELWELRFSLMTEKTPEERALFEEEERRRVYREHGKRMSTIKKEKNGESEIKLDVLDCFRLYAEEHDTQQKFMDQMRRNHEKLSQRQIERWLADIPLEDFPKKWKKRPRKEV